MNKDIRVDRPGTDKNLSVLIADDHQLVRDTLAHYLAAQPDIAVTTVDSLDRALSEISGHGAFDVVLLDASMPGMRGVSSVDEVVTANTGGAVVVFSGNVSREYVTAAISHGAMGFIPKTLPSRSLVSTIRLIASGEVFVPSSFLAENDEDESDVLANLSSQERIVLMRVCEGDTNKEIAREMNLSEVTIKMYMRSICSKLGAKNRTHAAIIAQQQLRSNGV